MTELPAAAKPAADSQDTMIGGCASQSLMGQKRRGRQVGYGTTDHADARLPISPHHPPKASGEHSPLQMLWLEDNKASHPAAH